MIQLIPEVRKIFLRWSADSPGGYFRATQLEYCRFTCSVERRGDYGQEIVIFFFFSTWKYNYKSIILLTEYRLLLIEQLNTGIHIVIEIGYDFYPTIDIEKTW